VHGAFVSDDEVHRVVEYLKTQGEPNYIEGLLEGGTVDGEEGEAGEAGAESAESDPMYDQAVAIVLQHRRASISRPRSPIRAVSSRRLVRRVCFASISRRAAVISSFRGAKTR
jgi:S-DNA-T family DNA segregation ATPase FtsK/SpoIIIE